MNKCNLFEISKLGNKTICIEAKYIDKLFGYKKSIKEINNDWGWLSLYQKYISILKNYTSIKVEKKYNTSLNTKRISIYKL